MPILICPQCAAPIEPADVNVATDVAFCRGCSKAFSLSGAVADHTMASLGLARPKRGPIDINNPPKGAWFHDLGSEFRFGASTRSCIAIFLVPFMLVWSGASIGGIYGSQIVNGKFDPLLSLFGIPFLLGSIFFWGVAIMSIWGRIEVTIRGDDGELFTGVGPIGRRRKFKCSDISFVGEQLQHTQKNSYYEVVLSGATRIKFGSMLNEERRHFITEVLRTMVAPPEPRLNESRT